MRAPEFGEGPRRTLTLLRETTANPIFVGVKTARVMETARQFGILAVDAWQAEIRTHTEFDQENDKLLGVVPGVDRALRLPGVLLNVGAEFKCFLAKIEVVHPPGIEQQGEDEVSVNRNGIEAVQ